MADPSGPAVQERGRPAPAPGGRAVAATAGALFVTMMGTTLPTPLYGLYAERLGLTDLTVTVLFAAYGLGVVSCLTLFGRLSDVLGRRPVLLAALGLSLLSTVLFLLPPALPVLLLARVVSGLSAGLASGVGTAAIVDLAAPGSRATAGALALAANTGGLALGTLFAGITADLVATPLRTPYAVHAALVAVAVPALVALTPAGSTVPSMRGPGRPGRVRVRGAFLHAAVAGGTAFAVTGVLTAVSAIFLARSLRLPSHSLAGAVPGLVFATMALGQVVSRRMRPAVAMRAGCTGLVLAAAVLAVALVTATFPPLVLSAATLGCSGGLCLSAGLAMTVQQVAPDHRGAVSSAYFAVLYAMLAVPATGVGVLADRIGLRPAGLTFAAAAGLLATAAIVARPAGSRPSI
ncbi:MFS transporter [Dactylosporangium matsuzakiense]|uniref:MFS transporter n=2 Tax=Dactylosporangium matsuzakiense TaxID=53360 RepID=A0A9W6KPF6_9ACTN|nr:MFS transporter [Dactylosporangium matsuzakiense]GLL05732.1 MFS transporter [Dactylosporangium matsuzakiense]